MARRKAATEEPVEDAAPVVEEPRYCGCGCGAVLSSKKARFVVGHDMRLKSRLLKKFDAGDETAGATLVENGWKSEAELATRKEKGSKSTLTKQERTAAKVERINVKIAKLVEEREALTAELEQAS